jgi:hypothetical protein
MPLTDEQKLLISKQALKDKIMKIEFWEDFKVLVNSVTPNKLKNLIKNSILTSKQKADDHVTVFTADSNNLQSLHDEIDGL